MQQARVYDTKPAVLDVEAGSYWWCACGHSKNQPWCDGAHKGTGMSPVELVREETGRVSLCNCKQTGNAPLCDGSHTGCTQDT